MRAISYRYYILLIYYMYHKGRQRKEKIELCNLSGNREIIIHYYIFNRRGENNVKSTLRARFNRFDQTFQEILMFKDRFCKHITCFATCVDTFNEINLS